MRFTISIVVRTGPDLTQEFVPQVFHAYMGARLERARLTPAANPDEGITPAPQPEVMHDPYCTLLASRAGGLLDVHPSQRGDLEAFLTAGKGTFPELGAVVVLVSPDETSQHNAVSLLDALVPGVLPVEQCRLLFVDCPRDSQPDTAYPLTFAYLRDHELDGRIVQTILYPSRAFESVQAHRLSLEALLHGVSEVEAEFAALREQGAGEKKLRNLGRRLMAARTVMAAAPEFARAHDVLGLPRLAEPKSLHETGRLPSL